MNPFTRTSAPHPHHETCMVRETRRTTNSYSKYGAAGGGLFSDLSHENAGIYRANAALSECAQRERQQVHAYGLDPHHKRPFRHQWASYGGRTPSLDTLTASLPLHGGRGAVADGASAALLKFPFIGWHSPIGARRTHTPTHTGNPPPAHMGTPHSHLQPTRATGTRPLPVVLRPTGAP